MSDVVSRLLAAIDEVEKRARAAIDSCGRVGGAGDWHATRMGTATVGSMTHEVWSAARTPVAYGVRPSVAAFMEGSDPESVLRLCQAHRDIVAMYQEAKAQPVVRGGGGLDHASAMGRLTTLGLVVQALAVGHGVEDGNGK